MDGHLGSGSNEISADAEEFNSRRPIEIMPPLQSYVGNSVTPFLTLPIRLECMVDDTRLEACELGVPNIVDGFFLWWFSPNLGFKNLEKQFWETTFFATIWMLWLVRNNVVFNGTRE